MTLVLDGRTVGSGQPCYIIAEIGINHEGSIETCARMVEEAARAGADAIKLQTVDADENYAPGTESHDLFSAAELSREDTTRMFDLGRDLGVQVFTTVGDFVTLDWVDKLNPVAYKISSGLLTSLPIVRRVAQRGRAVLMSTGMATLDDIDNAVETARTGGAGGIGLFQCTSIYPAPLESLNLSSIRWMAERYEFPTGFSDHSEGIEAAPLAVAAGAVMLEKHFSLDPVRAGFDHRLSLTPADFANMVGAVRRAEQAMGTAAKQRSDGETQNAARYHRTLAARRDLEEGTVIGEGDIGIMRLPPGHGGLLPVAFDDVIGRSLAVTRRRYDPIRSEDLA